MDYLIPGLITLPIFFVCTWVSAQSPNLEYGISISAFYGSEFLANGYVQVREWELEGDKMYLEDLGMNHYPAIQLLVEKQFRRHNSFSFCYEQYFLNGSATLDQTIAYNGTFIDGTQGIDVSPSRYFRLSGFYRGNIDTSLAVQWQFMVGLVYDHVKFCLDGEVMPGSPRNEVCEHFGSQALPYPVLGISTKCSFENVNLLKFEISGTYIPLFESFYVEGGNIHLHYSTFLADLKYIRYVASWNFNLGTKFRYMHLFQESQEDTNDLEIQVVSPYLGVGFVF